MIFRAVVKTIAFKVNLVRLIFGQLFQKLGLLLLTTSGHAGRELLHTKVFSTKRR